MHRTRGSQAPVRVKNTRGNNELARRYGSGPRRPDQIAQGGVEVGPAPFGLTVPPAIYTSL